MHHSAACLKNNDETAFSILLSCNFASGIFMSCCFIPCVFMSCKFTSCSLCPATWSVNFTSCNFLSCNFDGPPFSCPSCSVFIFSLSVSSAAKYNNTLYFVSLFCSVLLPVWRLVNKTMLIKCANRKIVRYRVVQNCKLQNQTDKLLPKHVYTFTIRTFH